VGGWHLQLFGGVSLSNGVHVVDTFGTVRAAKLLALLGLVRSGRLGREQLADQLWPDDFYDATRLRLRQEIHRLKRALGPASGLIGSSVNDVWLERGQVTSDLDLLQASMQPGRALDILPIVSKPFLPGWDDPWVVAERGPAERAQARAGIFAANRLIESGDAESALRIAQALIEQHPLDEELRMVAVSAHAKLGSMAAAMAEYQDLRRKTKDQLGVDTAMTTEALARELAGAVLLDAVEADWERTIPTPLDAIFGREAVVTRVVDTLQGERPPRLMTLVGPGGIGKTRVAIEVAHRLADVGERRVGYVSLAEVSEEGSWVNSALAQLGQSPPGDADPLRYFAATLQHRPTVLVLDNLESILLGRAADLAQLLERAPSVRVLCTSVTTSRVQGEVLVPVGPLDPLTGGAEILRSALQEYRPSMAIDQTVEDQLKQVATRLDGYPLALRLAAARLRLLSPRELLAQLDRVVTAASSSDLPARHRSLESALQSSFDSLDKPQRDALERIWAFPGGLGMELAAIHFADEPYLDLLESLLDTALIVLEDKSEHARIRLLVPVRRYLEESLDGARKADLQAQARQSISRFVEQFDIAPWLPLSLDVLERLDAEVENIRPAWHWLIDHEPEAAFALAPRIVRYEVIRGRARSLLESIERLRDLAAEGDPFISANLELTMSQLAFACHREELAIGPLDRAAAIAANTGDAQLACRVMIGRALYAWRKDFHATEPLAQAALEMAEALGDDYTKARAYRLLGNVADYKHATKKALELVGRSYEALIACNAETEVCNTGIYYGTHLWYGKRIEESEQAMDRSRELLARSRDPISLAYLFEVEGRMAIDKGQPAAAEASFRESLRIWEAIGSSYQEADQLHSLSRALMHQGKWNDARRTVVRAADKWVEDGNEGGLCCTLVLLAEVLANDGELESARVVLTFARAFQAERSLVLVQSELDHREEIEARIGPGKTPKAGELTLASAHALFDRLR